MKNKVVGRPRRKPSYYLFYLLFSPDAWRLLMGVAAAVWLAPMVFRPDMTPAARVMICVMLTCIGWAATGLPAGWICRGLRRIVLGGRGPRLPNKKGRGLICPALGPRAGA